VGGSSVWATDEATGPTTLVDSSGVSIGADAVDVRRELKVCFGDGSSISESLLASKLCSKASSSCKSDELGARRISSYAISRMAPRLPSCRREVPGRQTQVPSSFSYQLWCRNRWTFEVKGRIGPGGESFWTSGAGTVCGVQLVPNGLLRDQE
jgi:hypothetical protein